MRPLRCLGILLATASCLALAAKCPYHPIPVDGTMIELAGLEGTVRVVTDHLGVPHIYAESDTDLARVQGWIHARDRFFQMDSSRRQASGTLAELVGYPPVFDGTDPGARVLGLRRAAARSEALLTPTARATLEAYAEGVNAYLADHPLPPEYSDLQITSVPEWSVIDSLVIGKGFDAGNQYQDWGDWFDNHVAACQAATPPCDGWALANEDVGRWDPMDATSPVPDATGSFPFDLEPPTMVALKPALQAGAGAAARRVAARSGGRSRLRGGAMALGSNAWGVAAEHSATGHPMVANDAHLPLQAPSIFYENQLVVSGDPTMNLSGTTFPGIPFVLTGLNGRIVWGTTTNYSDRSDAFRDRLLRDAPGCPARLCIESEGQLHPVEERSETYRYNSPTPGIPDNLVDATFLVRARAPEAVDVLTVPFRSFGPVVEVEDRGVVDDPAPSSLETMVTTWQYAGLHGTREVEAIALWARAQDVFDFRDGVKLFAGVSQNWVVGDVEGNLAYFTSGEIPLRTDLEAGSVVDPPDLLQGGSGPNNWIADPARSEGQTIPYQILPFAEMPQTINPANGFVVTANNDPAGAMLDNDPLNQYRPGRSSIYYANSWDGTQALRAGRITRLLREKIDAGEKISPDDMKRIQANTQQLDAELMMPFLLQAGANAEAPGASTELASLAADPGVAEALARLAAWDFSTPTGIPEGYDGSDVDGARDPVVSPAEAAASVAATLYNVWRAHAIENTIVRALQAIGVSPAFLPSGNFSLRGLQHLLSQDPFTGVGASGVDFFPDPAGLAADERRDVVLLQALRDALDDLASSRYADAFGNSTDQDDYRWGKLNRVHFTHPLGSPYSTPPGYRFRDLGENLPGLARDGGGETVSTTGIDLGATGAHAFESSAGSSDRLVMVAGNPAGGPAPVVGWNAMPGGASGYPFSPFRENQLGLWLTADHHPILTLESEVQASAYAEEQFVPPTP